jgi:hypothetical protein
MVKNPRVRRVEREANRVLGASESVYLKDGSELSLGQGGRPAVLMDVLIEHREHEAAKLPLTRGIIDGRVDFEETQRRDPDLADFLNLIRILTGTLPERRKEEA